MTTFALAIGLVVVNVRAPGRGHRRVSALADGRRLAVHRRQGKALSFVDFVTHIVPSSVVGAFAQGDMLQMVFFAVLFGVALASLGADGPARDRGCSSGCCRCSSASSALVMVVAPIGAFGAMAYTIGNFGLASLLPLGRLMVCVYPTMALFIFVVLEPDRALVRASACSRLLAYIKEEILLVLGTSRRARRRCRGCSTRWSGSAAPGRWWGW